MRFVALMFGKINRQHVTSPGVGISSLMVLAVVYGFRRHFPIGHEQHACRYWAVCTPVFLPHLCHKRSDVSLLCRRFCCPVVPRLELVGAYVSGFLFGLQSYFLKFAKTSSRPPFEPS
jgi:hypothetical protein